MPGDKSISHRAAMIAALANGSSRIRNFSTSEDCAATLRCLEQLGVSVLQDGNNIIIQGKGFEGLRKPSAPLDCGNSGTTLRLLAGIVAGQNFAATLTGDESLCSRPMERIIGPLEKMGASISSRDGRAPLRIRGRYPLTPFGFKLPVASAQVKSAILFAGLRAEGRTQVTENVMTRDHTERLLPWFGVPVELLENPMEGWWFSSLRGPAYLRATDVDVPGDISSAAYFIAAAALLNGSSLEIVNVGVNVTRTAFLGLLSSMGLLASAKESEGSWDPDPPSGNEPVGIVRARYSSEMPAAADRVTTVGGPHAARAIDELPLLAMVGSQLDGGLEIRDAAELRVKESDRIATTVAGLRAMGADVEEFEDGLRVKGPTRLRGALIDPRGDHRIAMTFAVAGLLAEGETEITGAECVNVSFPEFFELLDSVVE